ncbi:GDSL family lipase [Wolbachia endosymbiont of Wiebesia pumilae]|uniref:GDSL family lipase n=1 Tax=Wolbachia endosymbiont of Wiebesia pumilae TaxID=2742717 RepID=UPI001AE5AD8D|nr:GDSL family lipase [Wolbachia endosymbiont of Wiebesia pumilae]QTP61398.1 GDSL family lipase [Wolbachia endosymbiont of Wiebesia pumilae]
MSLISLGYIFTYYFLLISSYSLSHFFSRQALKDYFFFDYFHPTAELHHEVGNEVYELI